MKVVSIMDDKSFELIEKMYIEFSKRFDNLEKEAKDNRTAITNLEKEVIGTSNAVVKLENELSSKMGIMFDSQQVIDDRLLVIESELFKLSDKVDSHDIKIQVLEGGKKKISL